ncbi:ShlB/FhaC/HecB family hemolysin secretion/activation protein [Burkholderia pseudomallei]|nr:ShlB/FhaC/HecB family hemolysin secretion/activation protein [Burkholderia pseudomallei]RPE17775.1 ShlB/FhaC/HecB family hemolysin secretion/activation protein [Burkholderia pseudomallei]RQS87613.1 ShlB/FhaC/HecB family hemolysin secretion/activation protein [Burkholderia pseudomallei]RQZ47315.1 ShlB/FhaC/HecB family hemolysin secretion/activation protein [Burkholderia pseudomallei]RSK61437.1 ShlB/FhaC/HecB family hemolysin secretion/activation protein [Burkholderia pseudomallei]
MHVPVFAQTSPAPTPRPVQDPAQLIIDQQREQARQRQLEQPPASITIAPTSETTLEIPPGTPVDAIVETGPTFPVQRIVLESADGKPFEPPGGVSRAKLDAVAALFAGHDLGSHRINVLLKRLTDVFVESGFVTTRALLGPQNLASGTLKVTIQVGRIADFLVNGKPIHRLKAGEASAGGGWLTDAGYENAFPTSPGEPLRLSDVDQGVAQINRLRRNQATVQILPGQSPGESLVDITSKPGDRLYYSLGVDNYGSSATGVTRYRAGVEADNLLGLQESLSLNFLDSLDSNALVGSFAIPFGRHTFSYTVSDSEYQQLIGTTALEYGRTLSHIFGWNYLVSRSVSDITSLDATLSWRRTDREVNGIDLDPQRVAVFRLGGNWLHKFVMNDAQGNFTVSAGVSQGLPWLGANHDGQGITRDDAHSQFTKLDATAAFTLPLPKLGSAMLAYRGTLSGQFTNVALFGSEQLYLGGMDTIRGFRSGEIAGDRGFYSRNELAWVNAPAWKDGRIEPYLFLDAGKANLIASAGFPTLAGAGAGLRAQWQWHKQMLSGELLVGRALTQPAALGSKATLVLGTLNWNM